MAAMMPSDGVRPSLAKEPEHLLPGFFTPDSDPGAMRSSTTLTRVAAVTAALVLLSSSSAAAASPASLTWAPCPDRPGFDCGTLTRPIDPNQTGLGTFGLALARHRATDPEHRIGVLVVNPGGPGQSGVGFAFGARWYFSPEVLAR